MIRNFAEAHTVLRQFYGPTRTVGPYTLERMQTLMQYLGNPQDSMQVVHVAGTSGKTSTSYYAAALLETSNTEIGLTVSPHVDEVNERVQINRVPLPESVFCEQIDVFLALVKASGVRPSYFECMVAFAFWEFAKHKVSYAVVEVGLGGLLDCTNVVKRSDKICVITDIGLDHTDVLGNTLGEIATQKAGIIQPQNHVFMYEQGKDVMAAVEARVKSQAAILHVISPRDITAVAHMPLFQQRNLYLAQQAATLAMIRDTGATLTNGQKQRAVRTHIPARMEIFKMQGKTVIVDGSHNGQKLGALAESIRAEFPDQSIAAIAGFVKDADERWQRGVTVLTGLADHIILTSFTAEQDVPKSSMDPKQVAQYCRDNDFTSVEIELDPKTALHTLLKRPEPILLIAGSFYLLNHIRPLITQLT